MPTPKEHGPQSQPSGHRATLLPAPPLSFTLCISPDSRSASRTGSRSKHGGPQIKPASTFLTMEERRKERFLGKGNQKLSLIQPQFPNISELEELRKVSSLTGDVGSLRGGPSGQSGGSDSQA